jgi:hypothetical protein
MSDKIPVLKDVSEKYFFINSNIVDDQDIGGFSQYIKDIGGNIGNSYITYSIIKILYGKYQRIDDIKNLWFYKPNQHDIDRINNEYSKVILILQDNIRIFDSYYNHNIYENLGDFFKKIKIPIIVFSLGSNCFDGNYKNLHLNINQDLIKILRIISEKTVSFGVRGDTTKEVMENLGIYNVEVVGCPTYFENGKSRIIKKEAKLNVSLKVLSGGYFESKGHDINYILQDESLFIKNIFFLKERILNDDLNFFDLNNRVHKVLYEMLLNNKLFFFNNMDKWRNFDKNFDFYIGSRVHGAIMAINSGLPAIVTNGDSRAKEMCNLFGIDCYGVSADEDLLKLYNSIDVERINKKYPILFDNFNNWLNKNGLKFHNNLTDDNKHKNSISDSNFTQNADHYALSNMLLNKKESEADANISSLQEKYKIKDNEIKCAIQELDNKIQEIKSTMHEIGGYLKKNSIKYFIAKLIIKIISAFVFKKKDRHRLRLYLKDLLSNYI